MHFRAVLRARIREWWKCNHLKAITKCMWSLFLICVSHLEINGSLSGMQMVILHCLYNPNERTSLLTVSAVSYRKVSRKIIFLELIRQQSRVLVCSWVMLKSKCFPIKICSTLCNPRLHPPSRQCWASGGLWENDRELQQFGCLWDRSSDMAS